MKYIFSNILKHWPFVILITILLLAQAYGDLALPKYTSDIIDTGIQNKGIEHILPERIVKEEYIKALFLMLEDEKELFTDSYNDKGDYYERVDMTESELDAMDDKLIAPVVMLYQSETSKEVPDFGGNESFEMINDDIILKIRESFNKIADSVGDTTLKSMGIAWAADCESKAGVDVDKKQTDYLIKSCFKMIIMALLIGVTVVLVSLFSAIVGGRIGRDLREKVFTKVLSFSNVEMDRFSTASLITRNTNDIQQVQMVSTIFLRMLLYAPILGIGGVIMVSRVKAGMGWIIMLAVIVVLLIVLLLLLVTHKRFRLLQKQVDRINLVAREMLTGISVIRAFGREDEIEEKFDIANTDLTKTQLFVNRVMSLMMPGMFLVMYAVNILIVWVAAKRIDEGIMQVGTMTAFLTYSIQIIMSFLMLSMMSVMLPRAGAAAERIKEVIDTDTSIYDSESAKTLSETKGVIEFKDVHFKYQSANEDVLDGISFKAEPGTTTAIIGSTGCGKSTLVNLIPRLYDVTSGSITLDGDDIRDIELKSLRDMIGFVPQKAVLFSGTVKSNLSFGNRDATDDEIKEAADVAFVSEFIDSKKEGYLSRISQGGSNVSGGQKQRLSIARAIAKNPKIYVFDDSFSALDMKTDAKLRSALSKKSKDSTVIIVAQRISTILNADQILVLDEGKIVGKGTHNELLKSCEEYMEIAKSQLSEEELMSTLNGGEG